jgi:hypothetical protein
VSAAAHGDPATGVDGLLHRVQDLLGRAHDAYVVRCADEPPVAAPDQVGVARIAGPDQDGLSRWRTAARRGAIGCATTPVAMTAPAPNTFLRVIVPMGQTRGRIPPLAHPASGKTGTRAAPTPVPSAGMTSGTVDEVHGVRVFAYAPDGSPVRDAMELVAAAFENDAELLLVPAERLDADFFALSTGVAGEFLQKLVNYRLRLAVVGDISGPVAASTALRDLVRETNRGRQAWFLATRDELDERLRRDASG